MSAVQDWDSAFEQIKEEAAEYYPGSTRQIIRHPNRAEAPKKRTLAIDPDWDAKPRIYKVNGEEMEFFTVGDLAKALGRKPVTIRKWEREGVIPKATFQVPGANDDPRGRRRLYSRAQVEGIVYIANDEGMFANTRKPFTETRFQERVLDLFKNTALNND